MVDKTYQPKVYKRQGGNELVVADGGRVTVEPGGAIVSPAGGTLDGNFAMTLDIADLSADAVYYLISPWASRVKKIWSVIAGAVSTADVTITASIGGVGVTDGVVTIATAASAAGDIDSATPSALNVLTAGQALVLTVAGGGAGGSPRGHVVVEFERLVAA